MSRSPMQAGVLGALWVAAVPRAAAALAVLCLLAGSPAWAAPELEFHTPPAATDPSTPAIMRDLAGRLLPVYQDPDPDRYLTNLSVLQMVAGEYAAAYASRQSLLERRRKTDAGRPLGRSVIYDIYAHARALEAQDRISFDEAFSKSFQEAIPRLGDKDAYAVTRWLAVSETVFREALDKALDQQRVKDSIGDAEAVELLRKYLSFDAYRSFGPLIESLDAEDDRRRYAADEETLIKTPDGASVAVLVVRPKSALKPLPALLEFAIEDSPGYAMECAAHGYAGAIAYARGKHQSPFAVVPYQHDGDDARAVINWIAKQSWSDGRVGMYGEGYSGFTPWAAATRLPAALKAIATSAPSAPGIDVPMGGSIFQNSAYRWSLRVTNAKAANSEQFSDDALWRSLDQKWYRSGRRYRDLGRLFGHPDPIFIRWLNHPSYDRFWQEMVPYREQFASINIPVLTITGFFAASEPGALYYFTQHHQYNRRADHTLLIGPYDDDAIKRGPAAALRGYELDPASLINLRELRYQWFDHIFKGGEAPPVLKGRVNYEVMGANEWRHAASVESMGGSSLRFYLDSTPAREGHRLVRRKNANVGFIRQTVDLADRMDAGWMPPADLISRNLASHNDLMFVSDRLAKPTEFDGVFSGMLDFAVNKMDLDLNIMLYERMADGSYVRLFNPTYEFRASYARDRAHRQLLKAGERQQLAFKSERIVSRQLQAGSRLVMVLGVNKRPDREINYGTGGDVSEESIADGRIALKIRWYGDSYVEIPVRK